MKRSEINIKYAELKQIYNEVLSFANIEYPWFKDINSKTKIENDLGLYGLDNEAFFDLFSNQFSIDFSQVNYSDYFEPETEGGLEAIFMFFVYSPFYLSKTIIFLLFLPFSRETSDKIRRFSFYGSHFPKQKDVTIGDLVVSVIQGHFAERNDFKITLKK